MKKTYKHRSFRTNSPEISGFLLAVAAIIAFVLLSLFLGALFSLGDGILW